MGPAEEQGLRNKTVAVLRDAMRRFPDAQLFFKMDVDTYVVPECLVAYAARLNASAPLLHGRAVRVGSHGWYAHGGAGYLVSRAALERAEEFSVSSGACALSPKYTRYEDVFVARCLASVGVPVTHSDRFFPETLESAWGLERGGNLRDIRSANPVVERPFVPSDLITLHRYKTWPQYAALHTALRFVRLPALPAASSPLPSSSSLWLSQSLSKVTSE